jgi:hypothetical protein
VDSEEESATPRLNYIWSVGLELKCNFVFEVPETEDLRIGKYKQRVILGDEREDNGQKSLLGHVVRCRGCFEIVGFWCSDENKFYLMDTRIAYELTPMLTNECENFV